jgi:hypothetical protein
MSTGEGSSTSIDTILIPLLNYIDLDSLIALVTPSKKHPHTTSYVRLLSCAKAVACNIPLIATRYNIRHRYPQTLFPFLTHLSLHYPSILTPKRIHRNIRVMMAIERDDVDALSKIHIHNKDDRKTQIKYAINKGALKCAKYYSGDIAGSFRIGHTTQRSKDGGCLERISLACLSDDMIRLLMSIRSNDDLAIDCNNIILQLRGILPITPKLGLIEFTLSRSFEDSYQFQTPPPKGDLVTLRIDNLVRNRLFILESNEHKPVTHLWDKSVSPYLIPTTSIIYFSQSIEEYELVEASHPTMWYINTLRHACVYDKVDLFNHVLSKTEADLDVRDMLILSSIHSSTKIFSIVSQMYDKRNDMSDWTRACSIMMKHLQSWSCSHHIRLDLSIALWWIEQDDTFLSLYIMVCATNDRYDIVDAIRQRYPTKEPKYTSLRLDKMMICKDIYRG